MSASNAPGWDPTVPAGAELAESTARFEMRIVTDSQASTLTIETEGQIDLEHHQAAISIDDAIAGRFDLVQDGTTLYVRGEDRGWVRIDTEGTLAETSHLPSVGDPTAVFTQLRGAENVHEVDETEIRGVDVVQISGDLDVEDTLRQAGMSQITRVSP
jgi:hypothetical protein